MFEPTHLESFLAVAQTRNFTEAGRRLRMFVIGAPPNCGGPGIPQRAITSSRSPSVPTRTIGAS